MNHSLIAAKLKPEKIVYGLKDHDLDQEGRLITLYFTKFCLLNAYLPNAGQKLERLAFKQKFNLAVERFVTQIDTELPVIYGGDLNCAHQDIDLSNPTKNTR